LDSANLPSTNRLIWQWFWRPRLALRGFFNIEWGTTIFGIMIERQQISASAFGANKLTQPWNDVQNEAL
jgi:hypothetical protein